MAQEIKYKARVIIVNHNNNDLVIVEEHENITKDDLQKLCNNCYCYGQESSPLSEKRIVIETEKGEVPMSYINFSGISVLSYASVNIIAWGKIPVEILESEKGPIPYEVIVDRDTNHHIANFRYYEGISYVESKGIEQKFNSKYEVNTYYISCGDVCVSVEPDAFPNVKRRFI